MKKIYVNLLIVILFFFVLIINGCCAYSFTGSNAPEHIKTIAIPVVDDRSGFGEPGLREQVTNELNRKFVDDNTLRVTDRTNANSVLECTITSISDVPGVVSAGETVSQRKLTISIIVVYKDLVKRKTVYERTFSQYAYYPQENVDNIAERKVAIAKAIDTITQDILLDTVSGW
ncbi:MAG: LptE family protein [Bacteroidota bacterium]|nr:LptE family protein [Bacteroidota bacterium]